MPARDLIKNRGWLRYGNSYPDSSIAPWPLGKLQVDSGAIQLALPWRKFVFPRKSIIRLMRTPGPFGLTSVTGFQIEHTLLEQPNTMIFWTHHFPEVKALLEKNGYSIGG